LSSGRISTPKEALIGGVEIFRSQFDDPIEALMDNGGLMREMHLSARGVKGLAVRLQLTPL
jgi:hypothetical protein